MGIHVLEMDLGVWEGERWGGKKKKGTRRDTGIEKRGEKIYITNKS